MITRVKAIAILDQHGMTPYENTEGAYDLFGEYRETPNTSFDKTVGVKELYEQMEVLTFLGYCCPQC
jgi:hypothetical protein|tara:strand:- start:201 stop:401 length:201 start_codon:yes stop_codon:yes gene_type:complete